MDAYTKVSKHAKRDPRNMKEVAIRMRWSGFVKYYGALWLYAIIKETGMLNSDLKEKALNNAKYVTRRAKQRMMNTITSLGTTAEVTLPSTTVRRLTHKEMKALKTTKFIRSSPVSTIRKGKIPF